MLKTILCATFFVALILCLPFTQAALAQTNNSALTLNGADSYVDLGVDNRGITNQLTLEAWIKTDTKSHDHIISKYDRDRQRGFQLLIQNGKVCLAGRDGSGMYRTSGYSNTVVADNQWHHIAGVIERGVWKIYVDGELHNQQNTGFAAAALNSDFNLLIGNYYYPQLGNHFYEGSVDELRIWNIALSEMEIRQHMCSAVNPNTPGLVGYYTFDNSPGGLILDSSSSDIKGHLINITPPNAFVPSGAPIGDISVYRYPQKWDQSLELLDGEINFSVTKVSPQIRGFHLYKVFSPPASTSGIDNHQDVKEYYGVFKVGPASAKYKVYHKKPLAACGTTLYFRQNNADNTWEQVADTTGAPMMFYTTAENYGEYAVTNTSNAETIAEQPVELKACSNDQITLDATTEKATAYTWNNGQTTPKLTVSAAGTYTATVIVNNCPLVRTFTVIKEDCPIIPDITVPNIIIPNIITPNGDGKNDSFVVQGLEKNTMEIKIFNRWGKSMYHTARYDNSWSAAGLPDGVYYYQLTDPNTQKVYKGWFEVIR
ncbi:LamG-like jellyroll fold domain-containing protein [Pontibacter oryzae]|uniref:T9SS C-terminal target domain-containing protein n=1 Tax=Pontibacter oryzae TaxID=2304593 RepID=A0A399SJN6_9BACT|nr:LamG-like jellyroll fold domain-containing protein [Pontibacter oryzae]RIJ41975.1 T9SS C-terminal target domain-containing protein [Pontibacter oryzae]